MSIERRRTLIDTPHGGGRSEPRRAKLAELRQRRLHAPEREGMVAL